MLKNIMKVNYMENNASSSRLEYQAPEVVVLDMSESTQAGGPGTTDSGFFS